MAQYHGTRGFVEEHTRSRTETPHTTGATKIPSDGIFDYSMYKITRVKTTRFKPVVLEEI